MSPAGVLAWLGFAVQVGPAQSDEPSRRLVCRGEVRFSISWDVATTSWGFRSAYHSDNETLHAPSFSLIQSHPKLPIW